MNTSTMNKMGGGRLLKLLSGVLVAGLLLGSTGCSTTKKVSINLDKDKSGFLSDSTYALLHKGTPKEIDYVYIAPGVDWKKYTKIWFKPVELWEAEDKDTKLGKLPKDEQQLLVDYLTSAVKDSLEKNYEWVDHGGPDVLVVHGAITEARKAKPIINLVTTLYPAALALSYGKQAITGTATGVGATVVEFELLDGETGKLLVAGVDSRAGTKALRTKFDGTWGDYRLACDWWAHRLALRLALARQGDMSDKNL